MAITSAKADGEREKEEEVEEKEEVEEERKRESIGIVFTVLSCTGGISCRKMVKAKNVTKKEERANAR